jgi:archaellum component FlaC
MTPFQITFYYLNNQRKIEQLEKSFTLINQQLELFENQHSSTIKNYLKNWQEELNNLTERYKKLEKSAQEKYDETIGDNDPSDEINTAYATHISGIDYFALRK